MSSGGVLRYSILIEALDKATPRLKNIMSTAQAVKHAMAFPETGVSSALRSQVGLYSQLTRVTESYSNSVYKSLKQSKYPFMADMYKAQASDAKIALKDMDEQSKIFSSLFRRLTPKTMTQSMGDMNKLSQSANQYINAMFPDDKLKDKRESASKEVQKFFTELNNLPKGVTAGGVFNRWISTSKALDEVTKSAVGHAFKGRYGYSMEDIGGMSQSDRLAVMNRGEWARMQMDVQKTTEKFVTMNKAFDQSKQQLKALSILFSGLAQGMTKAMMVTKPLAEAIAFSGNRDMARTPFSHTNLGVGAAEMGQFYRSAARSPYESDMISNQNLIMDYTKMFNQQVNEFVPVLSGMQTIFGDSLSMQQKMMMLTGASMKSNVDFSGWFTLYMQGAIPQMASLQNNLNETLSVVGALSNQGLGAFAGFGLSGALQAMIKPSPKSQEMQAMYGLDLGKTIRTKGIIEAFEEIDASLNKLTNKQRLDVLAQVFPGMGTGVVEILMKSTKNARELNRDMTSMMETNRANIEVSKHGYNQLMQLSSTWSNAMTGFLYNVSNHAIFKGFTRTLTDPAMALTRMQEAGMGKPSLMGEIMTGLTGTGLTGLATAFAFNQLGFQRKMAGVRQQMDAYTMAGNMASMHNIPLADAYRDVQYRGQVPMSFPGTKLGGVLMGGLQGITILAGIYTAVKSVSNATQEYYAKRNKEEFADPITRLSIADFEGGKKDREVRMQVYTALREAKRALEMNTAGLQKVSGKGMIIDPALSTYLLGKMAGGK